MRGRRRVAFRRIIGILLRLMDVSDGWGMDGGYNGFGRWNEEGIVMRVLEVNICDWTFLVFLGVISCTGCNKSSKLMYEER